MEGGGIRLIRGLPQEYLDVNLENSKLEEGWELYAGQGKDLKEMTVTRYVARGLQATLRILDAEQEEVEQVQDEEHASYEVLLSMVKALNGGKSDCYVTSKALFVLSQDEGIGLEIPYPQIPIAAVLPEEPPCIFCHVDVSRYFTLEGEQIIVCSSEDVDELFPVVELRLPSDSLAQAHNLYESISQCSALYPFDGEYDDGKWDSEDGEGYEFDEEDGEEFEHCEEDGCDASGCSGGSCSASGPCNPPSGDHVEH